MKKKKSKKMGRPVVGNVRLSCRVSPDTLAYLKVAAALRGLRLGEEVEQIVSYYEEKS